MLCATTWTERPNHPVLGLIKETVQRPRDLGSICGWLTIPVL
jgi:hypothetical protein